MRQEMFGSARVSPREEDVRPLARRIHQHVRRGTLEGMWREPIAHANAEDSGVAGGDHVNIRVANDGGLSCVDTGFAEQRLDAERVRLFGMEAVTAVDLKEKL